MSQPEQLLKLSAVISVHNEEDKLAACLEKLSFADEIVVVMDRCTDGTRVIAEQFTDRLVEGAWDIEGDRRNAAIEACAGEWIFEIDADEHVTEELAGEILDIADKSQFDWHEIPVDNYIGDRLVRYGWGASYGKAAYPGLFRNGVKIWGLQRVHPSLTWSGKKGAMLTHHINHYVDRNISDMIKRLDSYTTARAKDLKDSGDIGSTTNNVRRLFSRFFKCYISRKGYKEGGYGLLIALFAGLYPLISHIKAKIDLS
ncbi:MAG: glycosyltransferase family 2 protein [Rhodospirillales bacterium]|nr:glycosyltransferase family 2 protein [Rhodospirillales bacterium]MDP7101269.1 glycosyltransferase family 2 protein [Rhodospirillales bacterium]MDP7424462.1 glycosyltransferase family 2 protein [Rhodospirillales bacterium]